MDHLFCKDVICSAVTCLVCIDDAVCSGEGSYLHIYSLSSKRHLAQYEVIHPAVIHGIKADHKNLVIFGQKSLRLGCLNEGSFQVTTEVAQFQDWIWDVQSLSEPQQHLAVALGHNTVALWDCDQWLCKEVISCQENCILYSAHFIGDNWSDLVLAAGVVFNEVVLWCPGKCKSSSGRSDVIGRYKGHEGVIFNIDYNKKRGVLCSVSDDRTIRLWDMRMERGIMGGDPTMTLYGHTARVWDARLMTDVIVSIGEDACCFVWNYDGTILKKFTGHKGQNIWSLAVNENKHLIVTGGGDASIRLWSLPVITNSDERDHVTKCLDVQEAARGLLGDVVSEKKDGYTPRLVSLLKNELLVMLQNGHLLGYGPASTKWRLILRNPEFQSYCIMEESPDNTLVAIGTIQGNIWVHKVDDGTCLVNVAVYSSKVLSLCWGSDEDLFSSGPEGAVIWWKLVITEDGTLSLSKFGEYLLHYSRHRWLTAVTLLLGDIGFVCGDKRGSVFLYQKNNQSQPGESCHSHVAIHGKTGVSFISQHDGAVYSAGRDGTYRKYLVDGWKLQLINTFKVFKGFEWLEKLVFTPDALVMGFHSTHFVIHNTTTNVTHLRVNCGGGHRSWGVIHSQSQTSFAFIKAKQVIITSTTEDSSGQVLLKPHLHGRVIRSIFHLGHLQLSDGSECDLLATGSEDTDVNINAVLSHPIRPSMVITLHRLQDHISTVSSLAGCPSQTNNDVTHSILLVSVGGRVSVNIWRVSFPSQADKNQLEKEVAVEHLAFSGTVDNVARRKRLKQLKESNLEPDPETRFMDVKVHRPNQGSVAFLYIAGSDGLLRVFVFEEDSRKLYQSSQSAIHQCCFLSLLLHEIDLQNNSWMPLLCSGGTDGRLILWDMSSHPSMHGRREMKVPQSVVDSSMKRMEVNPASCEVPPCFEAKTRINEQTKQFDVEFDYHCSQSQSRDCDEENFIESTESLPKGMEVDHFGRAMLTLTPHQSGINAMASKQLNSGRLLLASGGDDNTIRVHLVEFKESLVLGRSHLHGDLVTSNCYEFAHAAQISGLYFLDVNNLVSCSIDQRLVIWNLDSSNTLKMTMSSCQFLCIPDVSCLTGWKNRNGEKYFAVSGEGVQVIHIKGSNPNVND